VFITAVPITKLFAWGEMDSGGHVLRETTRRGRAFGLWSIHLPGHVTTRKAQRHIQEGGCRPGRRSSEGLCSLPPPLRSQVYVSWRWRAGSTAPSGEPLIRVRSQSSPCRILRHMGFVPVSWPFASSSSPPPPPPSLPPPGSLAMDDARIDGAMGGVGGSFENHS